MPKLSKRRQHCKKIASLGGKNSPHNHPTPSFGISPKSPLISSPKNKKRKSVPPTQWKAEELPLHQQKKIKKSKKEEYNSDYQKWEALWKMMNIQIDKGLTKSQAINEIAPKYNVEPRTIYNWIKKANEGNLVSHMKPGRPSKLTEEHLNWIKEWAESRNYCFNYRYLVRSFQEKYSFGSLGSLWNLLEKAGWKTVIRVVRPLLTEKHKEERIKWCEEHKVPSTNEDHVTVHVDEKWFFFAKKHQRLHVPPGVTPEPLHVIHKCHIPKVMVLAAIAKPSPIHNFNGCLGCWPITEEKIAKRNSKNRPKGTVEDVPTTLNGKLFIEMMRDNLGKEIIHK
jgi:transposase